MVLLARDPRATMSSRQHMSWCNMHADCHDPAMLCSDLAEDFRDARKLAREFPGRIRLKVQSCQLAHFIALKVNK